MAFSSWLLSNVLGILLVMVMGVFLFGLLATHVFPVLLPPGSDPRYTTIGPCIVAAIVASIVGGFLTARLRVWLERE